MEVHANTAEQGLHHFLCARIPQLQPCQLRAVRDILLVAAPSEAIRRQAMENQAIFELASQVEKLGFKNLLFTCPDSEYQPMLEISTRIVIALYHWRKKSKQ
jgi:hypothetical protein